MLNTGNADSGNGMPQQKSTQVALTCVSGDVKAELTIALARIRGVRAAQQIYRLSPLLPLHNFASA